MARSSVYGTFGVIAVLVALLVPDIPTAFRIAVAAAGALVAWDAAHSLFKARQSRPEKPAGGGGGVDER